jgi:hypothetical protein
LHLGVREQKRLNSTRLVVVVEEEEEEEVVEVEVEGLDLFIFTF